MILVALTSLATPVETEIEALALDLGIKAYEVRARILGALPAVIFASRDPEAAGELRARVAVRGHRVVSCERAAVEPSDGMYIIRRCRFDADALVADGERLPYDDLLTLVLSNEDNAHTLYLFRRSGDRTWLAREGDVDPADPEAGTRVAEYKRFSRFQRELRRRARLATFDDRLLERVFSPSVGAQDCGTPAASASDILAHMIRLDVAARRREDDTLGLLPGEVFAGKYRVVSTAPPRQAVRGPRYFAECMSDGGMVSLKLYPRRELGYARVRAGFLASMRAWQTAQSSHAVEVTDHGIDEESGALYVATELLRGLTLDDLVARLGALRWVESREIVRRVGEALIELRAAGVNYGALRPADVFVAPGAVKLLHAGITPLVDASLGRDPHAPELCAAAQIAHIAFFALTGKHYFKLANEADADPRAMAREVALGARRAVSLRAREYGKDDRLPYGFEPWFHACVGPQAGVECADVRAALAGFLMLI